LQIQVLLLTQYCIQLFVWIGLHMILKNK
jgi:hypothetical protein